MAPGATTIAGVGRQRRSTSPPMTRALLQIDLECGGSEIVELLSRLVWEEYNRVMWFGTISLGTISITSTSPSGTIHRRSSGTAARQPPSRDVHTSNHDIASPESVMFANRSRARRETAFRTRRETGGMGLNQSMSGLARM